MRYGQFPASTLQAYLPGATVGERIDRALSSADNIHAAYELFVDGGRDWSDWTCKPRP